MAMPDWRLKPLSVKDIVIFYIKIVSF